MPSDGAGMGRVEGEALLAWLAGRHGRLALGFGRSCRDRGTEGSCRNQIGGPMGGRGEAEGKAWVAQTAARWVVLVVVVVVVVLLFRRALAGGEGGRGAGREGFLFNRKRRKARRLLQNTEFPVNGSARQPAETPYLSILYSGSLRYTYLGTRILAGRGRGRRSCIVRYRTGLWNGILFPEDT